MMNYCEKIEYSIYKSNKKFSANCVDELLSRLPKGKNILRLVFFDRICDNEEYEAKLVLLREKINSLFFENRPVLTFVSQAPLDAEVVLEVQSYMLEKGEHLSYRSYEDYSYVVLENHDGRFLFVGGIQGKVTEQTIKNQADFLFKPLAKILKYEQIPVQNIIRQWNYIEQITKIVDSDQNYQLLNNARSDFYRTADWSNGYPAATGIGTQWGGLLVDLDAAQFFSENCFATPIDNKLQIAAHTYSTQVLEVAGQRKMTPKFERAKSITFGDRRIVYISGTAAIRGEEALVGVGLKCQLQITMENIAQLTGDAKLRFLRVYLKEHSFYEEAHRLMEEYRLDIPISYLLADVCRDELLIEIEGIAIE